MRGSQCACDVEQLAGNHATLHARGAPKQACNHPTLLLSAVLKQGTGKPLLRRLLQLSHGVIAT